MTCKLSLAFLSLTLLWGCGRGGFGQSSESTGGSGNNEPEICPGNGQISYERWLDVEGRTLAEAYGAMQSPPDETALLTDNFGTPINVDNNFAGRLSAWVCPEQTGDFVFWMVSDNHGELRLSPDPDSPGQRVASQEVSHANPGEWDLYPSQQSEPVRLQAGRPYFLRLIFNEEAGGDHGSAGWQRPDGVLERPIPARYFSADNL